MLMDQYTGKVTTTTPDNNSTTEEASQSLKRFFGKQQHRTTTTNTTSPPPPNTNDTPSSAAQSVSTSVVSTVDPIYTHASQIPFAILEDEDEDDKNTTKQKKKKTMTREQQEKAFRIQLKMSQKLQLKQDDNNTSRRRHHHRKVVVNDENDGIVVQVVKPPVQVVTSLEHSADGPPPSNSKMTPEQQKASLRIQEKLLAKKKKKQKHKRKGQPPQPQEIDLSVNPSFQLPDELQFGVVPPGAAAEAAVLLVDDGAEENNNNNNTFPPPKAAGPPITEIEFQVSLDKDGKLTIPADEIVSDKGDDGLTVYSEDWDFDVKDQLPPNMLSNGEIIKEGDDDDDDDDDEKNEAHLESPTTPSSSKRHHDDDCLSQNNDGPTKRQKYCWYGAFGILFTLIFTGFIIFIVSLSNSNNNNMRNTNTNNSVPSSPSSIIITLPPLPLPNNNNNAPTTPTPTAVPTRRTPKTTVPSFGTTTKIPTATVVTVPTLTTTTTTAPSTTDFVPTTLSPTVRATTATTPTMTPTTTPPTTPPTIASTATPTATPTTTTTTTTALPMSELDIFLNTWNSTAIDEENDDDDDGYFYMIELFPSILDSDTITKQSFDEYYNYLTTMITTTTTLTTEEEEEEITNGKNDTPAAKLVYDLKLTTDNDFDYALIVQYASVQDYYQVQQNAPSSSVTLQENKTTWVAKLQKKNNVPALLQSPFSFSSQTILDNKDSNSIFWHQLSFNDKPQYSTIEDSTMMIPVSEQITTTGYDAMYEFDQLTAWMKDEIGIRALAWFTIECCNSSSSSSVPEQLRLEWVPSLPAFGSLLGNAEYRRASQHRAAAVDTTKSSSVTYQAKPQTIITNLYAETTTSSSTSPSKR